jgi:hypothetical protein
MGMARMALQTLRQPSAHQQERHYGYLQGTKPRAWSRPYRYAHGRAGHGAMVQEAESEEDVLLPLRLLHGC